MSAVGSQGSLVSNYQPRQLAQVMVYSLTPGNVQADDNAIDVVTSTIPLFGSVAYILFDSGTVLPILSFRRLM